jgi:small subunit ribosomal protein S9
MNENTETTETAPETAIPTLTAPAVPAAPPKAGKAAAVGRRKKSTARVRIFPGSGKIAVNGRPVDLYFFDMENCAEVVRTIESVGARARYDVVVKVSGGGMTGQAGAVSLGLARALSLAEPDLRAPLRADTYMTRDARRKERKKYGRRGARRGFQFSKR